MDKIDIHYVAEYMNLAEKNKVTGEEKEKFVMEGLQKVLPPDIFVTYQDVILFLIRTLCSVTKHNVLGINKAKFSFSNLCLR